MNYREAIREAHATNKATKFTYIRDNKQFNGYAKPEIENGERGVTICYEAGYTQTTRTHYTPKMLRATDLM